MSAFLERATPRVRDKLGLSEDAWAQVKDGFGALTIMHFAELSPYGGTALDLALLRTRMHLLINRYVSATQLRTDGEGHPIYIEPVPRAEVELLKQLTWYYVIHDPALATLQEGHARLVKTLFRHLLRWLASAETEGTLFRLPKLLQDLYTLTMREPGGQAYANAHARRARAVADYIASLTEGQALNLHDRLTGTGNHSVLDPWLAY